MNIFIYVHIPSYCLHWASELHTLVAWCSLSMYYYSGFRAILRSSKSTSESFGEEGGFRTWFCINPRYLRLLAMRGFLWVEGANDRYSSLPWSKGPTVDRWAEAAMTVTYTAKVATSNFSCFLKLLLRWAHNTPYAATNALSYAYYCNWPVRTEYVSTSLIKSPI